MDRLRMLQFNGMQEILHRIGLLTDKIYLLLLKGDAMAMSDSETIYQLYIERSELLGTIESELNNEHLDADKIQNISNFLRNLKQLDEKNINLLKNNITNLSEKLKKININKSLMIYSNRK